jgi:crotonobetainyl-CoA:carnitine CoA-transferase CaiB-like acyl-CoA transferase
MSANRESKAILAGYVVLDLASLITGPYCATMLADLGAEVIKLEYPQGGDLLRHLGIMTEGESSLFLSVNRNKKGVTLNLERPEGRQILDRAIARADVIIENFRPDIKKRYKLTYDEICRVNPDIIYLSITGFGESGPYKLKPGVDHVFQGISGITSVSGEPKQGPLRVGFPVADMTASLYATIGVISALLHRERSGQGQQISINLLDAAMCMQTILIGDYFISGKKPVPCGNESPFAYPVGVFQTVDGYIAVAAFNNKFWENLCQALTLEELPNDPRFNTPQKRLARKDELKPVLVQTFKTKKTEEWHALLEKMDVPCGPVHDYESVFKDPQVIFNNLIRTLPHSRLQQVRTVGNPIRLSKTPPLEKRSAPVLGEDTIDVLRGLGFDESEIGNLREKKII